MMIIGRYFVFLRVPFAIVFSLLRISKCDDDAILFGSEKNIFIHIDKLAQINAHFYPLA